MKAILVERKYVSVLTKQDNGTYKYESVKKEVPLNEKPLSVGQGGARWTVPSDKPGDFALLVRDEHDIDLRQDRMALQRLKDAAEKAKCELSAVLETEINLPFIISTGRNEALHLQTMLSRDKLEELTSDLIERTIEICARTLEEAEIQKSQIEDVILVGGMTRMPKVQDKVKEFFEIGRAHV